MIILLRKKLCMTLTMSLKENGNKYYVIPVWDGYNSDTLVSMLSYMWRKINFRN